MALPEHKHFYFIHGKQAGTIEDMKEAISEMSETEFKHHVNAKKNDFANWAEEVLKEKKLALELRKSKTKKGIIKILGEFVEKKKINYSLEFRRFIVKEFIYGMIFGLIIGFILAKLV